MRSNLFINGRLSSETIKDGMRSISPKATNAEWDSEKTQLIEKIRAIEKQNVVKEKMVA